jgi:CRP-like cAMP-binding protein
MSPQERTPSLTEERLRLLQNMPVFGGLSADTLSAVLETAAIVRLPRGEFFFREGDEGDSAYVLERGKAMFWKKHEDSQYPMRTLGEGECFGEMAMIGIYPRSGSTQAIDDCVAIKITYETLSQMLRRDPQQCVIILMNMARDLSRRLRDADNLLLLERATKHPEFPPTPPKGVGDKWMPI